MDQNPANGGTPASAREPIRNVQNVMGIFLRRPPISLMLFVWTAWITAPDPRNRSALKNACVNRWKNAPVRPAGPIDIPATMYASWLIVEYARTRLMSSWTNAISAAPSIVMPPTTPTICSTTGSASVNTKNSRPTR